MTPQIQEFIDSLDLEPTSVTIMPNACTIHAEVSVNLVTRLHGRPNVIFYPPLNPDDSGLISYAETYERIDHDKPFKIYLYLADHES